MRTSASQVSFRRVSLAPLDGARRPCSTVTRPSSRSTACNNDRNYNRVQKGHGRIVVKVGSVVHLQKWLHDAADYGVVHGLAAQSIHHGDVQLHGVQHRQRTEPPRR